jgi:hypothetical protein
VSECGATVPVANAASTPGKRDARPTPDRPAWRHSQQGQRCGTSTTSVAA